MDALVTKIKCPHCGAVLAVKMATGIESKTLKCPACGEKSPFYAYKQLLDRKQEEHTVYPDGHLDVNSLGRQRCGALHESPNYALGQLKVLNSDLPIFRLKIGKNIIGRRSTSSTADFQIFTGESKRLSREHLFIEVKKIPGRGFVHYASLCKMKSNVTYVNSDQIEYGDCVVLHHNDIIKFPDISVKFELPDEDETDL